MKARSRKVEGPLDDEAAESKLTPCLAPSTFLRRHESGPSSAGGGGLRFRFCKKACLANSSTRAPACESHGGLPDFGKVGSLSAILPGNLLKKIRSRIKLRAETIKCDLRLTLSLAMGSGYLNALEVLPMFACVLKNTLQLIESDSVVELHLHVTFPCITTRHDDRS